MSLVTTNLKGYQKVLTEGTIYQLIRPTALDKVLKPSISIAGTGSVDIYLSEGEPTASADMIKISTAAAAGVYDINVKTNYICIAANGAGTRTVILTGIVAE
jgi:hypothetical protein